MKLLIVTNLFPNCKKPHQAVFNLQQFSALAKLCPLKIVAPFPFFQFSRREVPGYEKIHGLEVYHPRYLVIPKMLRFLHGVFFFLGIYRTVKRLERQEPFDIILVTWAYPDAFAVFLMAKLLNKKYLVKVHGSDINILTQYWAQRKMILHALHNSEKILVVSQALQQKLHQLGIASEKTYLLPNGVNKSLFFPRQQIVSRQSLKLPASKKIILFVGNLAPVKGVNYLIEAVSLLPKGIEWQLHLVGDGPSQTQLQQQCQQLNIQAQVLFHGRRPHQEIPLWLNSADIFCLPSLHEGYPNVLVESLACATPVVATRVGGVEEIIQNANEGTIVPPKDSKALASALAQLLQYPSQTPIASRASWDDTAKEIQQLINQSISHV